MRSFGLLACALCRMCTLQEIHLSSQVGMLFRFLATGIGSFVYPYVQNWQISLVLTAIVPIMMIMGGMVGKLMTAASKDEMDIYGKVGARSQPSIVARPGRLLRRCWQPSVL
jgi:ABC-type multidrug transport system fused ATPase/permease subunit